ncbi:MAG: hypothetical protein AB7O48_10585, partial [Cyclobacteriaceae bacterium]
MRLTIFFLVIMPLVGFTQANDAALANAKKKLEAKDFTAAKAELSKLLETSPKNKVALSLRGQARMGLEDFYGAIADFTFALEVDSTFAEALNFRGESKIGLGDDYGA